MSFDEHKKIVEQWMYGVFAQGNISLLDQLLASEFISTDPSGKIGAQGPEPFKQWLH